MKKLSICIFGLTLLGCSFLNASVNVEPIAATITEFSACREDGESETVFSSDVERIFGCGFVETLNPVDVQFNWYYENELVFQQAGADLDGPFYSFVEPGKVGSFPVGNYRIDVLIEGTVAKSAEFRVEE